MPKYSMLFEDKYISKKVCSGCSASEDYLEEPVTEFAEVLALDLVYVYILCPFCGMIHRHESFGDSQRLNYDTRIPRCAGPNPKPKGDYNLVTTPRTLRRSNGLIAARDLKQFAPKQRRKRRAVLEQRYCGSER